MNDVLMDHNGKRLCTKCKNIVKKVCYREQVMIEKYKYKVKSIHVGFFCVKCKKLIPLTNYEEGQK